MRPPHRWRFFRAGGLDQVKLETGADIAHLDELDQKLWVALSCPVSGVEFDEKTLALLDVDRDGQVRVVEVLAAVAFCRDTLRHLDGLLAGSDVVSLASIRTDTDAGSAALDAARQILAAVGRPDAASIALADIVDITALFANTRFDGDGVITPTATTDAALTSVIADAIATVGTVTDRRGAEGVSQALIDAFYAQLAAYDAWMQLSEVDPRIRPLGEKTAAAAAAFGAVKEKIDDYFARCRVVAYDPRAQTVLEDLEQQYRALGRLSAGAAELAAFPLARIGGSLPLVDGVNPAWSAAITALHRDVVTPILGTRAALSEADWDTIVHRMAPHGAWAAMRPTTTVDRLGLERVRALLASDSREHLAALVAEDKGFEQQFSGIALVERLLHYHRDLHTLLLNFTSFTDFYAPDRSAIFQSGTLYLDSRACELCVWVDDPAQHATMAALSRCYLAYCEITRAGSPPRWIAAVFSRGDSDFLMVGRHGVFYDRRGRDWDATVVKVLENPISLGEAFLAPYKRFVRMVEEQVAKRAAAADAASSTHLAAAPVAAPAPRSGAPAFDLSSIALIGVAVSGAAAVIGAVLQGFLGLGMWMPIGFLGIILLISGPSVLITALKLRQRTLGPILDANGWAINGRIVINVPFGGSLTQMPTFPEGSQRSRVDPYQARRSPWVPIAWLAAATILLALSTFGAFHLGWLPQPVEAKLGMFGVAHHLRSEKAAAQTAVDEALVALSAAQAQATAANKTWDELAAVAPTDPTKARAGARRDRAAARLTRAEDKLEYYEDRLSTATEALEMATDAHEARVEKADAR